MLLDHVVIRVNDLAVAVKNYAELGFTVIPGGEHKSFGSRNALIAFADDTYLELIAFSQRFGKREFPTPREKRSGELRALGKSAVEWRVLPWASADEGLVDFALVPRSIEIEMPEARARGLNLLGPFPGNRLRPDGQQVAWQFGVPDGYDLPFLCADVTPRALRVPTGAARKHANGVLGIRNLSVAVRDLESSTARYRALLAQVPLNEPSQSSLMTRTVDFAIGETTLTLAQLIDEVGPLRDHLTRIGEGPTSITLGAKAPASSGRLDRTRSHGAVIELQCLP